MVESFICMVLSKVEVTLMKRLRAVSFSTLIHKLSNIFRLLSAEGFNNVTKKL